MTNAHPHVGNGGGKQSSFRFADLNNPNLTDFAKAGLKQTNEEVLRGKAVFSPRSPLAGRPGSRPTISTSAQPIYFIPDAQGSHHHLANGPSGAAHPIWTGPIQPM